MRPVVPKSRLANEGGRAEVVADSGEMFVSLGDRGEGSASVPRNEVRRGLVRILRGISSRIVENVNRWAIRLGIGVGLFLADEMKDELNHTS